MSWFHSLATKFLHGQTDEKLRERYEIEARRMFQSRIVKALPEVDLVELIAELTVNDSGRLGVIVAAGYRSRAVHEINRNGTFSERPPYWTKKGWRYCTPRRFVRCHFVRTRKIGNPMKSESEQIRHVGHAILEFDTPYRPYQTFENWKLHLDSKS